MGVSAQGKHARGTATAGIGVTKGTDAAPWLAISVTTERYGPNPLVELRERYDAWRRALQP